MRREKTLPISEQRLHVNKRMLIDADNVSARLGPVQALEDISLCIHSGEFIGLIGPNGAGKSTLLKVLLGLMKPTAGTVTRQKAVYEYVPQRGNTYSGIIPLSVREIVGLAGRRSSAEIDESLAMVGLSDLADRRFNELSAGQQQRVAIAKALTAQADMLVVDEPTTGIDENSQREFYAILQRLQGRGITILMVSHEIETVLNLVNRVICLNQSILYDGKPEHFEADKHLPGVHSGHHRQLHHHHEGDYA